MSKKKYEPRPRPSDDQRHHLASEPARDPEALILPLSAIKASTNIRFQLDDLSDMVESVREHGILQPLLVTKTSKGFLLIAGRRRYEAAKLIGLKEVPVRVKNASAEKLAVLRLIENLIRSDLSPIEEVSAVAALVAEFGGNQSATARSISRSQTYVNRCCRAAKQLESLGTYATSHSSELTKSALFELADSKEPQKLLEAIKDGTVATVQETRAKRSTGVGPKKPRDDKPKDRAILFTENQKTKSFRLRIHWNHAMPEASKTKVISTLEDVLSRLKEGGS